MATKKKAQGLAGLAGNVKAQARKTASDVAKIASETPQRILGDLQKGLAGSRDSAVKAVKAVTKDIDRAARALKGEVDSVASAAKAGVGKAKTKASKAKTRAKTRVTKAKTGAKKATSKAKTRVTKARRKVARANGGARAANMRRAPKKTARKR